MDRYLLEESSVDGFLLEDGSGVLLLEGEAVAEAVFPVIFPSNLDGLGGGRFFGNRVG
jgi:hypothetical protein